MREREKDSIDSSVAGVGEQSTGEREKQDKVDR